MLPQRFRSVRVLLVLALSLPSVVACGSGSPTAEVAILPTAPILTATPLPTGTPVPTATPTATPTPEPTPDPALAAQAVRANELGWVLVLEYHLIEEPEGRWSRTPANFRADIERLIAEGYYPINLIDLATGHIDVPAGKSPVVLTFDDSSSGQFRYLEDGTIDPNCAVGILLDAAQRHPEDWRMRATFFILLDVDLPDRIIFGQPEWAEKKLQDLVSWGMEIGSHTISHFVLSRGTPEEIRWQLAVSENQIESLVPGFEVRSLSVPLGEYPADIALVQAGLWEGQAYDFDAVVEVAGGASPSPFSINFDPYHIRRTQAIDSELEYWLPFFQENPELRYISDGNPDTVAIPDALPERLQGLLRSDLPPGKVVIRYFAQP